MFDFVIIPLYAANFDKVVCNGWKKMIRKTTTVYILLSLLMSISVEKMKSNGGMYSCWQFWDSTLNILILSWSAAPP